MKLSKVKSISIFVMLLALSACSVKENAPKTQSPSTEFATEEEILRAATSNNSVVSSQNAQMASELEEEVEPLPTSETSCMKDPACVSAKVDTLLVALSNYYLKSYLRVSFLIAGVGNGTRGSGGKYSQRILTNSANGYQITSKTGQPVTSLPPSGTAAVAIGGTASGNGKTPYAGAALAYVNANSRVIAVAGADIYGYSYCYFVAGYVPVCDTAGW